MASLGDRIEDPVLRQAVKAMDAGDLPTLKALLAAHPDLSTRRAAFEDIPYFRSPALLAFVAENPTRHERLPGNIVEIALTIIEAGTAQVDIDMTLALTASGRVAREAGVQIALIELLVTHGADMGAAMNGALAHGEFEAAEALLRQGAPRTLPAAAALGFEDAEALLAGATAEDRHLALAFAAQFGRTAILKRLLEAGEDPNRFNPPGAHAHSTPLHQAALAGHAEAVRVLLEHGARRDLRDALWNGTPGDWARHSGRPDAALDGL